MKVAFLGIKGLPSKAGADRVVEAVVTRMPKMGIQPTVYCDAAVTPPEYTLPGVNLVRMPAMKGKHMRSLTLALSAARHAVFHSDYDLIHLHNVEASFVLPLLRMRYKVISTSHGCAYWRAKWGPVAKGLIRMMDVPFMGLSTATTCVSAKDARMLGSRFGRSPLYVPNGVGSENVPNSEGAAQILRQHKLQPGRYTIFTAGRIEPTKGAHLAILAVNQMESDLPLLVVGDENQVPEYRRELHSIAGSRIHFQPLIKDSGVLYGLMSQASCLVFPSTVEAMSMVLLEAASLGVPVICSDIEENRQVMQQDASYFISGNVSSLEQQLEWLLAHPVEAKSMSTRAAIRVCHEYAWDAIALQYAQLYQLVCAGQLNRIASIGVPIESHS